MRNILEFVRRRSRRRRRRRRRRRAKTKTTRDSYIIDLFWMQSI